MVLTVNGILKFLLVTVLQYVDSRHVNKSIFCDIATVDILIYHLSTFIPHPNITSGNIFVEHSNNICRIMKLISLHLVSKWNQSCPQWESCTGYD